MRYYTWCFVCKKEVRGDVLTCGYCKSPRHGEDWEHFYGLSNDPEILSKWSKEFEVSREQKRKSIAKSNRAMKF